MNHPPFFLDNNQFHCAIRIFHLNSNQAKLFHNLLYILTNEIILLLS